MKQILDYQIYRLSKIYVSRPASIENVNFLLRVGRLQVQCIKAKREQYENNNENQTIR